MKKYRYKVMQTKPGDAEDIMNQYADDGYEVVSTTYWFNFKVCMVITFKKEITEIE